jgi:hypothetical protein
VNLKVKDLASLAFFPTDDKTNIKIWQFFQIKKFKKLLAARKCKNRTFAHIFSHLEKEFSQNCKRALRIFYSTTIVK